MVFGLIIGAILIMWVATLRVPDFSAFEERKVARSTKIYDRNEEIVLFDIHQDIKRTVISIDEMGENIQEATIAIEDKDFYSHNGVQIKAIIRALFANLKSGEFSQGGSTITQQIVKNTLLTSEKRITRKLKEAFLALKVEKEMSKDEILEIYLNESPYGGSFYGIKETSNAFFDKDPIDLTVAEAAYLAAIPQAPTFYSPYGEHKDRLDARQRFVLDKMYEFGFITEEEYEEAKLEVVEFLPRGRLGIKAPHFVFYVREYLEERYGTDAVESGGLQVTTTLDYDLQEKAEEIVLKHALQNEELWNASNAALVAIDPNNGEILTMVGSRDYFDEEIDGSFNVATAVRQPGSSFKPFIYATAMTKGYTPNTTLFDVKTEFQSTCNELGLAKPGYNQDDCYSPSNYDNAYLGPLSLREALAQSRNVPSVKLLYLTTIADSLKTAKNMGITTLTNPEQYGLTLVLGGGEVKLLDMTSAYGAFATEGVHYEPQAILKVTDADGNVLEEYETPKGQKVLDENSARIISDILSDNEARTPLFGSNSFVYFGETSVAGKTGTTNNNRDAWMMGYTPEIAVGVWSGNNDNTPMTKGSAISGRLWREFMDVALTKVPHTKFTEPFINDSEDLKPVLRGLWQGSDVTLIDNITGNLATEWTPEETLEQLIITDIHSILHWVNRNNPNGPIPGTSNSQQYKNWETPVQNWWIQNNGDYEVVDEDDIPTEYDDIHTEENQPEIKITYPTEEDIYELNQEIDIEAEYDAEFTIKGFDVFVNNTYIGSTESKNLNFSFVPKDLPNIQELNRLKVIVRDKHYNKAEDVVEFYVDL